MYGGFEPRQLVEAGFSGFEPLHAIGKRCMRLPECAGIYVVVAGFSGTPGFLERSIGGRFKAQDGTVPVRSLVAKWIDGADLLYAGRSGSIRRRVGELAGYGRGEPIGHRGGRYLWQLAEHDRLLVGWRPHDDPVRAEREPLEEFEERFGQLPFANIHRGTRAMSTV